MKKYKITYPIVAGVLGAFAIVFFGFISKVGVIPTIWMTIGASCGGLAVARVILHLIDKDRAIRSWQVSIYALLGVTGWMLAAFSQGQTFSTLFTMIAVSFGTIFAGSFLPDVNGDGIPDMFQPIEKVYTKDYLMAKALYKFKGDVLGAKIDKTQPLCVCNGKPYTVAQALAEGFVAEAEEATIYIESLYK